MLILSIFICPALAFLISEIIYRVNIKCKINQYFYCTRQNEICMYRYNTNYKHNDYNYHKEHLYDGFDKLEKNETYHCKSHSLTLHYLQQLEKSGHVEILDDKRITAFKKNSLYECWLQKPNRKRKRRKMYKIKFKILKTLPENKNKYKTT